MLKWKHVLLALAFVELAIGFSNARPNIFFYLGLPLGTILLGLFLIFQVLEKESALFDEQKRAAEQAQKPGVSPRQPRPVRQEGTHYPAPTTAHSH